MCPTNCFYITIAASRKPFKTLMNDHIMYKKICNTIYRNACANAYNPPALLLTAKHNAKPARNREDEKECIVFFKRLFAGLVMIFVQSPQKTVHYIFMRKPRYDFHYAKRCKRNKNIDETHHKKVCNTRKNNNWIINKCTANWLRLSNFINRKNVDKTRLMINQQTKLKSGTEPSGNQRQNPSCVAICSSI